MTEEASHPILTEARAAYAAHEWKRAQELLQRAQETGPLSPEDLHRLAWTRWIGGVVDTFASLLEQSYEGYVAAGANQGAAIVALDLYRYYATQLRKAVANGWLKRAETLLADEPESPAHGYGELNRAFAAQQDGRLEEGLEHATRAAELGRRFGDRNLEALAQNRQGRLLLKLGRVGDGRALMDEAMVAAVGGELSMSATGIVCCSTIDGCTDIADYGRAADWTDATKQWCERKSISGYPGICRVHHAEISRLRGSWQEAERDARRAVQELEHSAVLHIAAEAYYEIGEIRLRMGDLEAADDAFRTANSMGRTPEPGSSLLKLARGKARAASGSIRRALEDLTEPLERARLLPAAVDIWLEVGQVSEAARAATELAEIAERFESEVFQAWAHTAKGAVALAENAPGDATRELRASLRAYSRLGFPYETARVRVRLARAYSDEGDLDAAKDELEAAAMVFEELGASLDLRTVEALLTQVEPAPPTAIRVVRTFVFTDIVDSTQLVESLGDKAWSRVLRWHDEALRSIVGEYGGHEIKHTGDGFHLAFEAPTAAIRCGVAIQRMLREHRKVAFAPDIRIGIHCAEAFEHAGDFAGVGVHLAARIAAVATGGEVLVSAETVEATSGGIAVSAPRAVQLKGIKEPVEVVSVQWQERPAPSEAHASAESAH